MKERKSVNVVREWIKNFKQDIGKHIDPTDTKAIRKAEHYLAALDAQLKGCDVSEDIINKLGGRPTGPLNPDRWQVTPKPPRSTPKS